MKILLTQFFSAKNKGDAAITSVMLSELRKIFQESEILISTTADINERLDFEGAHQIKSLFFFAIYEQKAAIFRILRTLYMFLITTIWSIVYRAIKLKLDYILPQDLKILLTHYITSDFIIFKGGGYINGRNNMRDNISLLIDMHEILLLKILGRETILYSQSIGPLGNKFQKFVTGWVLNKTDIIFAREQKTIDLLKEIGVTKPQIIKTVDAAFLFTTDKKEEMKGYLKSLGVDTSKKIVGITAREWLDDIAQEKFESELAKFADYLISKMDMQVLLVPQVVDPLHNEDDAAVNNNIRSKIQSTHGIFVIKDGLDHYETKGIYENLDLLVGTRMHSCIFALSGNIPVIPIEYEYKTSGIMNDLGLGEWVIKIEEVTADRLIKMFLKFTAQKDDYLKTLTKNIPFYINEARKTVQLLKEGIKRLNTTSKLDILQETSEKKTVSIGIPAYNEEGNIGHLINALLKQKGDNFTLKEIIVVSDASTDKTAEIVKSIPDERIMFSENKERAGKPLNQNKIVEKFTGDILLILDADILPKNEYYIQEMVRPFDSNKNLGIVSSRIIPIKSSTFFGKIISYSVELKNAIFVNLRNGNNAYLCHGSNRAFSRSCAKKIIWPSSPSEDAYSYFTCLNEGYDFFHPQTTGVFFRSPDNFKDHLRQSARFITSGKRMARHFPEDIIRQGYEIPFVPVLKILIPSFFLHPLLSGGYFVIYSVIKFYPKKERFDNPKWNMSMSSKILIQKKP